MPQRDSTLAGGPFLSMDQLPGVVLVAIDLCDAQVHLDRVVVAFHSYFRVL